MRGKKTAVTAERITAGLGSQIVGREVAVYDSVDSTNLIARVEAAKGAAEGLVVLADEQMAGRGRLGRRWVAPAGTSILMSILLRPELAPHQVSQLTMVVSLATIDAIREVSGVRARLKWPNDILIGDRKAGGLLSEAGLVGERLDFAVVGLGLNVNFDPAGVPGIPPTATSLMIATGRPIDRVALIRAILQTTDMRYRRLCAGESPHVEWSMHLTTLGHAVRVTTPARVVEGIAEGVDSNGALILRRDDGSTMTIVSGDVTLR